MNTVEQKNRIARINRKLAERDEKLRTSRTAGQFSNLGDYYIVDVYRNAVVDHHVNPAELEATLV